VKPFEYFRPETLDELLALLSAHAPHARLLAGGTDLMVRARKGMDGPLVVVDLKRVADLRADITRVDTRIRIGARAVITDIIDDASIRQYFPALVEAALVVGSIQIRNRATLVGNICNASPAADTAPALLAYSAVVNAIGTDGPRSLPLDNFFAGPGRSALAQGEVVASVDLPLPSEPTAGAFERLSRRHGVDLAIVNLCCVIRESGTARFGFGAVGPRPILVECRRDTPVEEIVSRATPRSDLRGGADYRMAMLPILARRALKKAMARMGR
jgi:CO/xanthine dehydrogenase FAD-binding subunit